MEDILNKEEEDTHNKETQVEEVEVYGSDSFDFDTLKKYWDEFAEQRKAEGKDSEYMVLKQNIYLKDTHTIVLKLTNAVKLVIIDKFRSDLITFLKTKLNNGQISLETELLEEEAKRMIYTNKEKFDYLAEKKPILKELQTRLGLDPDF